LDAARQKAQGVKLFGKYVARPVFCGRLPLRTNGGSVTSSFENTLGDKDLLQAPQVKGLRIVSVHQAFEALGL
jgi:hypothetical protein